MGLYLTSFLCGATIMVLEILGFRLLAPYFGYSISIWGSLLGVVMMAMTAGYYMGGFLADRRPHSGMLYLMVLVAAGYTFLLLFTYPAIMRFSAQFDLVAGSLLATLLLFAIPMTTLSTVSPFVIRLLAREGGVGTAAGRIYAISTVGSIVGTFLTSFYLIPTIGTRASLMVSVATLTLMSGLGLLASGAREWRRRELAPTSP